MNLNSQYLVLFKNPRDKQQIAVLARQMYPHNSQYFMKIFEEATKKPYGHLVVDLKQDTPDQYRLKSNVIKQNQKNLTKSPTYSKPNQSINAMAYPLDQGHRSTSSSSFPMDLGNHSCVECGILFASPMDLARHCKHGCPEEEERESKKTKYDQNEWIICHKDDVEKNDWCNIFYDEDSRRQIILG